MLAGFDGQLLSEHVLEEASTRAQSHGWLDRSALRALRDWLECHHRLGPASSLRAVLDVAAEPLVRILGYDLGATEIALSKRVIVSTLRAGVSTPVLLVVTSWGERLDAMRTLAVAEAARRAANWCLLFSGTHLRLLDTRAVYSNRYAQFELELVLDDELATHGLWSSVSAPALAGDEAGSSSTALLIRASEERQASVSRSLKNGVLAACEHMLRALIDGRRAHSIDSAFEQALTLVYRVLFLLFAEARLLVPLWHPVYRESYSLEALCRAAARGPAVGLWDALRAVGRLAHSGCRAGDLRVTPFNGRLFAPARTPLADRNGLDNEAARHALLALSTRAARDREGLERISYRDLGVEQIGAIYETLLDYTPRVDDTPHIEGRERRHKSRTGPTVSLRPGSGIRKATGTFYTPQPFVRYLVRQTLEPLVAQATPDQILDLRVLDPSMGSGAFLVGACTFLAESFESALIRSGSHRAQDFGTAERAAIRRTVAERCLFGVDLNPMAVQLARLSLWLATLAADRPLSFLDHHLVCGDSLLGAWLTSLRLAPGRHRRIVARLPLFEAGALEAAMLEALPVRFTLAQGPNDTPQQVRAKERALAALRSKETGLSKWKRVADCWCAYWFSAEPERLASAFSSLAEAILSDRRTLPDRLAEPIMEEAARIAGERPFFHWELEFPELFFSADGKRRPDAGFDAIIGNPPWEMIRADANSPLSSSTERAATVRFTRTSGVYSAQSDGHANSYQLFLERAGALARPGGRLGLVLPFGLACDHGSAALRRHLFSQCAVDVLVGFENRRGVFPIHRGVRFLLMTATKGTPTEITSCRFGETDPTALDTEGHDTDGGEATQPLRLSRKLIEHLSGPDLSIPYVRTKLDLTIAERAALLFSPLGDAAGWNIRFGRELNATDDRDCLRPPGRGWPVIEGWQVTPFSVNIAGSRFSVLPDEAARRLGHRHERPRLAYRDVASPTNRVTLIAAVLPGRSVTTHTLFCLRTDVPVQAQYFLSGLFNSLVVNYLVRLRVSTHVTTAIVERLPIPTTDAADSMFRSIASLTRLLARRDHLDSRARLDALVASLYQLTPSEFAYVLSTFPLMPQEHRDLALREFMKAYR